MAMSNIEHGYKRNMHYRGMELRERRTSFFMRGIFFGCFTSIYDGAKSLGLVQYGFCVLDLGQRGCSIYTKDIRKISTTRKSIHISSEEASALRCGCE